MSASTVGDAAGGSGGGEQEKRGTGSDPISHDAPTIPTGAPERFAGTIIAPVEEVESFGAYRVLRKLGEGGFGVVYACEQREPIRRQVALKVIKLGMDTREVIARFEAERQALAVMDHPNVAKVLDAGVTPRGRPYFVMEYVAGMPITDYCDQAQLTMKDRLQLFIMVCHAVQHAHQKGIIHRDIKPSNVLVTLVDAKPVPKVIDFGIAKATGQHLTSRTMFTEAGRLIGTPEYMSPEQAGLSPLDVDTRTDVYALGVLLYELLTGVLPHEPKKLRSAAMAEIQRIIREVEPARPSTRLGQLGADTGVPAGEDGGAPERSTVEKIAHRRRMEAGQLVRELRGDLDWITMKAMEKDRSRRYDTAAGLAADIEHYLRNEPVLAGPPSAVYRMRKFARRNRAGVLTAAVFALLIAGGVMALSAAYGLAEVERGKAVEASRKALAEAERADRERQAALDAKKLAEEQERSAATQARRALAALQLVSGMFESIDPNAARGREVTVRQILDDADKKMRTTTDATPDVEATVREIMSTAYHRLAEYGPAEENMRLALAIRERDEGPDGENTLQDLHNLGATLASKAEFEESDKLLSRAAEGRSRVYGEKHRDTLASKSLLVYVKQSQGDIVGAERVIREVIAAQTELLGPGDKDTIDSSCSLADILQSLGKYEEADAFTAKLLDTATGSLGRDAPLTLQAMSIRGSLLNAMGRFQDAESLLREALALKVRVFGPTHTEVLLTQNSLAMVLDNLGKADEAEAQYRELLATTTAKLGEEHPQTLSVMNNLAQLLRGMKKYDEAEKMYRDALAIRRRVSGDDNVDTLTLVVNLGMLMSNTGQHEKALAQFEDAFAGLSRTRGPDHWMTAATAGFIGAELVALGRDAEGEKRLLEAHAGLTGALGPTHDRTRLVAGDLADLFKKQGNAEQEAAWRAKAKPPTE
jgi:serine/threonine protein kinase